MDLTTGARRGERDARAGGKGLIAASLGLMLLAWLEGIPRARPLEAQQARVQKADPPVRIRMEYRQDQAPWTSMAEVLNRWEARGWETFQIVPIQSANPGAGGAMQVALVFRRPAR